ncbi:archease [Streptomyces sp. NPDC094472]|uniref:archease n=1 Tax=unclassified Streptomyces TaxID=2593676 RepID=UPI003318C9F9
MVGDTDNDREARRQGESGHRTVPHTADVRIEAWGATREHCLAEAALGLVECFADTSVARTAAVERIRLAEGSDEELLTALLEEVIYWLEVPGRVPVEVETDACDGGLEVRAALAEFADVEIIGAVPKGVSWHELRIGPDPYGWSCAVTIDV